MILILTVTLCGCASIKISEIEKLQTTGVYTSSFQYMLSGYGDLTQGESIRSLAKDIIFSNFNHLKLVDLNPEIPQIGTTKNVLGSGMNSSLMSFDFIKLKNVAKEKGCSSVFYAHAQFVGDLSNKDGLNKDIWGSIQMGLYDVEKSKIVTEIGVDGTLRDFLNKVLKDSSQNNLYSFYEYLFLKGIKSDKK